MPPEVTVFPAMGVHVSVGGATGAELAAVAALFEEWEGVFSRFRPGSELCRINRHPHEVVLVSPLFARAARTALRAAAATEGHVDPSLGAAIEAVGYDRDFSLLSDDGRPPGLAQPGPGGGSGSTAGSSTGRAGLCST